MPASPRPPAPLHSDIWPACAPRAIGIALGLTLGAPRAALPDRRLRGVGALLAAPCRLLGPVRLCPVRPRPGRATTIAGCPAPFRASPAPPAPAASRLRAPPPASPPPAAAAGRARPPGRPAAHPAPRPARPGAAS